MLDTRELGRRPGTEREVSVTAPAPADLGIEVLRVPEGEPVEFDLRLEAVVEGVLVTGSVSARLEGECARCLDDVRSIVRADLTELYVYDDEEPRRDDEDGETSRMQGDLIDLEPVLRDAVVLALPFQPLCQDDCPGLCVDCGARLADDPDHGHDDPVDPRWAALQGLVAPGEEQRDDPEHHPGR